MNRILSALMYALLVAYIVPAGLSVTYFNYQYGREHDFLEWVLFGTRVATLKGIAWPYFVWETYSASASDNTTPLLAEQGNADAQNKLGLAVQDDAEAVRWFRKAADQGLAVAQNNLGFMYTNGRGVTQDYAEAVGWYRKAADQGLADAQNNLGGMYDTGRGVPHDDAEAVKWFRKAAEQGLALAQSNLAICYATGQSVRHDYVEAYKWFYLAAAGLPASDTEHRAKAIKGRDLVASNMTPAQIAEAQALAREWKPK